MATCFKADSKNSRNWFNRFVVPALRAFGFVDIVSTEEHDSDLKALLDYAGIDALAKDTSGATVALASRVIEVKPYGKDYDCFSLRDSRANGYKTEKDKMQRAIDFDSLRPMWHVQTFIDNGLATAAIVRTRDLVNYIATHKTKTKTTRDGTEFKLAFWNDLRLAGITVRTIQIGAKK